MHDQTNETPGDPIMVDDAQSAADDLVEVASSAVAETATGTWAWRHPPAIKTLRSLKSAVT